MNNSEEGHEFGKALCDKIAGIIDATFKPEEDNVQGALKHTHIAITDGSNIPDQLREGEQNRTTKETH